MVSREGGEITRIELSEVFTLALQVTLALGIWDEELLHRGLKYGTDGS
jgi:hypothetical protein